MKRYDGVSLFINIEVKCFIEAVFIISYISFLHNFGTEFSRSFSKRFVVSSTRVSVFQSCALNSWIDALVASSHFKPPHFLENIKNIFNLLLALCGRRNLKIRFTNLIVRFVMESIAGTAKESATKYFSHGRDT